MSAGLNDSPKFISALGQLVREALHETVQSRAEARAGSPRSLYPELLTASGH